jgi:ribosomal protein S18 acetylase RimI-like enzyme
MKEFWQSVNNKILVARKKDTQSIVGYAIFSVSDSQDSRFGKKRINSVYLLRIGVRINSQRQGIGRKLVDYLLDTYPEHALSLDVSTDNITALNFY